MPDSLDSELLGVEVVVAVVVLVEAVGVEAVVLAVELEDELLPHPTAPNVAAPIRIGR